MTDGEEAQFKQLEDQKRKEKVEEHENSQKSEKLEELKEDYSDQLVIEEDSYSIQADYQEDQIDKFIGEEEKNQQGEDNSLEESERTESSVHQKAEGETETEIEEKGEKEQALLLEEYEDQLVIWETPTEDHVVSLLEEEVDNSIKEQVVQETEMTEETILSNELLREEHKSQVVFNEQENDDQRVKEGEKGQEIEKTKNTNENSEELHTEVKTIQDIHTLIKELNTQLETQKHLEPKAYRLLANLHEDGTYPNIAIAYKRDGSKIITQLDRQIYDKLIDNQKLGTFRLEWQRFWFEGLNQIKSTKQGRKIFLLDLSEEKELPVSMRRIYLARNAYTWNTLAPTKRELHSKNINDFIATLFGKRAKFSDFKNVKNFTYQKKMNIVWKEFQRVFKEDINLKTTKRPALFALKNEYTRENIEHALIGTFWQYHHNLDRIGRRNMKQWGYNNLLQYMKKKATGVYPSIVDPNYIGQKFIIRVVHKGKAFARFLDTFNEIKESDPKCILNRLYRSWIIDNEILQSKAVDGLTWGVDEARETHYINFNSIAHLMSEKNTYGVNAVLEALFENKIVVEALKPYLSKNFQTGLTCISSGYTRINSGASSTAYPDLIIQADKPINVQIKDLGKCFGQDKKALVIFDQFKSFLGISDDFENITIHIINGVDLASVYDLKSNPDLTQNNVGIISIGIWDNTIGISKFGELFSALKIAHDNGYTGSKAFIIARKYIKGTGQSFNKTDEETLRELQDSWSGDPMNLMMNILEVFGNRFKETFVRTKNSDTAS